MSTQFYILSLLLSLLVFTSGCTTTKPEYTVWESASYTANVAKVKNTKSLISPGFY